MGEALSGEADSTTMAQLERSLDELCARHPLAKRAALNKTIEDAKADGNAKFKAGEYADALACWMRSCDGSATCMQQLCEGRLRC